jgi:hypothetical protein
MNKATLIPHQGWADFFSLNSIFNIYSKKFDEMKIFVSDEDRKKFLTNCLSHLKNVSVEVPHLTNYENVNRQTCIKCHTYGLFGGCPRQVGICEYVDYSQYQDYQTHIKIGAFKDYDSWEKHKDSSTSFSNAFYTHEGLDLNERINSFKIYRDEEKEPSLDIKGEYIACHEDVQRNIFLKKDRLSKNMFYYNLDKKSNLLTDQIKILEASKEIHFIDSSYSVMVYYLSFHNDKIKNIPKFLHSSSRTNRDTNIYQNPTPENWEII